MTADLTALLDAMQARCDAATEGPWVADGGEISQSWKRPEPWKPIVSTAVACMSYCYGGSAAGVEEEADAEFIAAARTDLPRLIAAVRAVLELADAWTARGEHLMAYSKTIPEEVGTPLLEAGAEFVVRARTLRHILTAALKEADDD